MEREILCSQTRLGGEGDTVLEYYLIIRDISEEYTDLKSYGVKINKISKYAGGGKNIEMQQINNIFCRKKDAEDFLKVIIKNKVTPVSLRDVAEDYVVMWSEHTRSTAREEAVPVSLIS